MREEPRVRIYVSDNGDVVCLSESSVSGRTFSIAKEAHGDTVYGTKECAESPTPRNIRALGPTWGAP